MLIKVYSNTKQHAHLWTYQKFQEKYSAHLKSHNMSGNIINYLIYEVDNIIEEKYMDTLGLTYEVINP